MNEFDLIPDSNANDNVLATLNLITIGAVAKLQYTGTWPANGSPQPNQLTLEISKDGLLHSFVYALALAQDKTFTATADTPADATPAPYATLTGAFLSSIAGQTADKVRIDQLPSSAALTNPVSLFAIQATAAGSYSILLDDTAVGTVQVDAANTRVVWTPSDAFMLTDGNHTLRVVPASAATTGSAKLSLLEGSWLDSATLKMVAVKDLPSSATNDTGYYLLHDTQQAVIDAGANGSVLAALLEKQQVLGMVSKDGTAPANGTNAADPQLTLANGLQLPIVHFDQASNNTGNGADNGAVGINFWLSPDPRGMNNIQGTKQDDSIDADALGQSNNALTSRDWINAGAGNDIIATGAGGDEITGGAGNDTIDGGAQTSAERLATLLLNPQSNPWELENRVSFSGPANRYTISEPVEINGVRTVTVTDNRTDSPDGTDTLTNVDVLLFTDKQIRLTPSTWVDRGWDQTTQQPGTSVKGVSMEGTGTADMMGADDANFAGSDRLVGNAGNDTLKGGAGADTFRGDKGNDQIDGGANRADNAAPNTWDNNGSRGLDVAEYAGPSSRYTISKVGSTVTVTDAKGPAGDGTDTLTNVEILRFADGEKNLVVVKTPQMQYSAGTTTGTVTGFNWEGTDLADTITTQPQGSSALRDWVNAGAGDDLIATDGGGDWIDAGEGNDTIDGGADGTSNNVWDNKDQVRYDAPLSRFTITQGEDSGGKYFTVTDGLPAAFGGFGTDKLYNIENLQFNDSNKDLNVSFNANSQGQNHVQGTDFADRIDTSALSAADPSSQGGNANARDWVQSQAGDDVVFTGAGGDTMEDSAGNDIYDGGADGNSTTNTWDNLDRVNFAGAQNRYTVEVLTYTDLAAGSAIRTYIDSQYPGAAPANVVRVSDKVPGGDGVNYVINVEQLQFNGSRIDVSFNVNPWQNPQDGISNAWVGNNHYNGGLLADLMDATGHDAATPSTGVNGYYGNKDWMNGGSGNDTLLGGAGGDEMTGGSGNDQLDGGANASPSTGNSWDDADKARYDNIANRYEVTFFRLATDAEKGDANIVKYNAQPVAVNSLNANSQYYVPSPYYLADGLVVVQDKVSDAKGGDGRDVLKNIEILAFSDTGEWLAPNTSTQPIANSQSLQYNVNGSRYGDKLVGRAAEVNWMDGRGGHDLLQGSSKSDTLTGGTGNDTLEGGSGTDTAKFAAPLSQFTVQRFEDSSGAITGTPSTANAPSYYFTTTHKISDAMGGLGTDTLVGVEKLQFSDTTVELSVRPVTTGNPYFTLGSTKIPAETKFLASMFADKVSGRTPEPGAVDPTAEEMFIMYAGDDTVLAGNGADYVDAGEGDDYIELGNDPFSAANTPPPSASRDVARPGPGNDTVIGGSQTDNLVPDSTAGVPSGTQFKVTTTANGVASTSYYTDTQEDIARYDDDAARYSIELRENSGVKGVLGSLVATYQAGLVSDFAGFDIGADVYHGNFLDANNAVFTAAYTLNDYGNKVLDYNKYVVVVRDSLSDALGGDGVDVLLGVDIIAFEGSQLVLNDTPRKPSYSGPSSVVPDTAPNGYSLSTSADGQTQTLTHTSVPAGTYATLVSPTAGYIDGKRGSDNIAGTSGNDSIQGWAGDDVIDGGAGDDYIVGGIGNDTLRGGEDLRADPVLMAKGNTFNYGDVAAYKNSLPVRFEIRKLFDDASGSVTGTANKVYFRVVDTASLKTISKLNGYLTDAALAADNLKTGIGFGIDTLIDVEHIRIGDTNYVAAPGISNFKWSSGAERSYIGGTLFDDVLQGTSHGDELDGRDGNDTLDGGVEATDLPFSDWDKQDEVRYTGDRERFDVRGVLVQVGGSGASKTYTVLQAGQAAPAGTEVLNGIQVTDLLPAADGGIGTDLLVNIERLIFNSVPFNIVPRINEYEDMSAAPVNGLRPKAVNATGTDFADRLEGKGQSDWISGGRGDDTLVGGAGGDNLEGGAGNDTLEGGENGAIDPWGNAQGDTAQYKAPIERFSVSSVMLDRDGDGLAETSAIRVQDTLLAADPASLGTDVLIGVESLNFNNRWVDLRVNRWEWDDGNGRTSGGQSGTVFDDIMTGDVRKTGGAASGQSDNLNGNAGNDVLLGLSGGDQLNGGLGNDVLDGGANGNTGEAWRDQDQVNYAGKQSQYSLSAVTVSADGSAGYTLSINGREAAKSTASGFSITDNSLSSDVQQVLTLANQALNLADGQHNRATLVVDKLSADLGGEGADLLFNVENLGFRDGQLETEVRINANDWNRDGQLDGLNVTGTTSADVLSFDDIVSRSGKNAATLQATQMDIDLRTGNDVYIGGAGGESVRPGAGNDYVDGGANEGQNAWGGDTRDEVRFEGKSSRYVLVDVSLSQSGGTWSVSSSKGLTYTVGSGVAVNSSNSELAPIDASGLLGMGQVIDTMVAHAGNQTTLSGWIVADRLPAAWQGTGVDALVNVEAIAFSDKWMPLNMQVFYQRAPGSSTVNAAHVDGTSRADVIGYASSRSTTDYNYTGDDHLRGNEGDDSILGGNGSDWIEGGAGNDTIDGGSDGTDPQGNSRGDTVRYSGDFERYTITTNGGTVTVSDSQAEGGDGIDTLTNVEGISFNDRWLQLGVNTWINRDMKDSNKIIDIHVRGSMLDDSIDASTGANSTVAHQLWGNEGNDTLLGGAGPDQFQGGAGDDVITGGANGLDAWGNPGVDVVRYEGSFARYTIEYSVDAGATWTTSQPSSGTLLIRVTDSWSADDGGTGTDLMSGIEAISFGDRYVMLESIKTAQDLNGDGVADVAEVRGTGGNDTLTGDNTNDRLLGEAGDDSLVGGAGGDWLHGGAGNDAIDGGSNGIDAAGRMLYDVAAYDNPSSAYTIAVGNDGAFTVTAGTDGTEGTDTLTGVEGLQFADRFISLVVDRRERDLDKNGSTDLVEVRGLDLTGPGDTLTYATGKQALAHALMGGLGDDSLTGGDAADLLEGGAGNDNLVGSLGADRARFAGNFADYDIQTTGELTTVLHKNSGADGQDTLQGVEELVFADRSYRLGVQSIISQEVDTNGDGTVDKRFVSGTDTADTLAGSATLANMIDTGSGNDVITGGNLGDDITPGTGDDRIDGGSNTGLNAAGNPNADRVFYRSKIADNSINAWQKASFRLSGAVEAGDVLSVQVGSKTITHVATSAVLNAEVTAFAGAIQTAVGNSIISFSATAADNTVTLLGKGLFAVTPTVSNGEHTVSESFTVAGANQTGKTLVLGDVTDLLTGMSVSYSAGSTGAQTTYGPFRIEAVNTTDKSVTLSDDITVSPSSGASLTVKQDNADTTTATTAVGYERWHEVSGVETGTDILQNVEQVMFADSAIQLSFTTKQVRLDGQAFTAFMGTGLDDLLRSSSAQEVFVGLGGRDRFVLPENSGVDVIKDFTPGDAGDVLTLILPAGESDGFNGTGLASVDAIMAKGVQRGVDTVIDLGAGNEVKLVGVTLSDLSASNFELLATF
jgi:Ca2+-binding RTX toxin-like protein